MPWQQQVALVGGELDPDTGLPAYREVVVTVPRQSGKTTLILAWEIHRALAWGRPQKVVYSAQTGNDARKKLIEDQIPILEPRKSKLGIRSILRGMGNEAIVFANGSRLVLLASSEDSGHGKTVHLSVRDELFADVDDRRAQAMLPGMITVADAQMLTASTAGTADSVPLNRLVASCREALDAGRRSDVAYFEWSAPDGADMSDEDLWWTWMPALGHTQTPAAIRHAQSSPSMTDGEFRRAFGNIATSSSERVIPLDAWDLVNSPNAKCDGRVVFAVDTNEERDATAIVAIDGDRTIEVVAHNPGFDWLPAFVVERNEKYGRPKWAYDASGPVASLVPELEKHKLRLLPIKGAELSQACGLFYDDVAERRISIRRHAGLDKAVAGAGRRFTGDTWRWTRRDSAVDISPLVAATLARWALKRNVNVADNVW